MNANRKNSVSLSSGLMHEELENNLLHRIAEVKKDNILAPVVVLVGSNLLKQYLIRKLIADHGGAVNVHFISFADLLDIFSSLNPDADNLPVLPDLGREAITIDLIDNTANPGWFEKIRNITGFYRILVEAFKDLENLPEDDYTLQALQPYSKWESLARLYRNYCSQLNRYRLKKQEYLVATDAGDIFERVYGTKDLIVYGFYDFAHQQLELIDRISSQLNLSFLLPFWAAGDEHGTSFVYATKTYNYLSKLVNRKPKPLLPDCGCAFKGFGFRLFRYDPAESESMFYPSGRHVRIFSTLRPHDETSRIINIINEHVLWGDSSFEKVGIILWNPKRYKSSLCESLEDAGIPYYDSIGINLDETPETQLLAELLDLNDDRISRMNLMDIISRHNIKLTDSEEENSTDPILWQRICLDAGMIEGDFDAWIERIDNYRSYLETKTDQHSVFNNPDQFTRLRQFITDVFSVLKEIPSEGSLEEFIASVRVLINRFIPENDNCDLLRQSLFSLESLIPLARRITREQFVDLFKLKISSHTIRQGHYGDGVLICDKMNCRGLSFELLFIPGLNQGEVPIPAQESPVINDKDRSQLKKLPGVSHPDFAFPLRANRRNEEKLLFTLAVDAARKNLYLSYSRYHPERARDLYPSGFLLELCRVMFGKPVDAEDLPGLAIYEKDSEPDNPQTLKHRTTDIERYPFHWILNNIPFLDRYRALQEYYSSYSDVFRNVTNLMQQRRYNTACTAYDGVLSSIDRSLYSTEGAFAVTTLEKYADCPFKYFITSILKAQPLEEPEFQIEIPHYIIGQVIHDTLEELLNRARDFDKGYSDPDWLMSSMRVIIEANVKKKRAECPAPDVIWKLTERKLKNRLTRFIREYCTPSREFSYISGETGVSGKVNLGSGDEKFTLDIRGRIDRMDHTQSGNGIHIYDYKTGNKIADPNKIDGGRNLQLPLYLKLLEGQYNIEVSAASYLQIDASGISREKSISGAQLKDLEHVLRDVTRLLTDSMAEGIFIPLYDKDTCPRCFVRQVCSHHSQRKIEYTSNDNRIEQLKKNRGYKS